MNIIYYVKEQKIYITQPHPASMAKAIVISPKISNPHKARDNEHKIFFKKRDKLNQSVDICATWAAEEEKHERGWRFHEGIKT